MAKQTVGEFIIKLAAEANGLNVSLDAAGNKIDFFVKDSKSKLGSLKGAFNKIAKAGEKIFFTFQGFGAAFDKFGRLTEAADRFESSERQLSATSKITGASLESLNKISRESQNNFNLTRVQANELTITLSKLTQKAGATEQTAEAIKRVLDVGAAQGFSAEQTLVAIDQAILGLDEGTDKLFRKNPSVLYIEFARSIGTSAGKLTDAQKAQALLNEVVETGKKVGDEYLNFLETDAGKKSVSAAKTEEMRARLGELIHQVMIPLLQIITPVIEGFTSMSSAMQRIILFLGALTLAAWQLIPALTALNIGLGPIGIAFLAIGALGSFIAAGMGETRAESQRLKQEMIANAPVMKGYESGLEDVSERLTELKKNLEGANSVEVGKKLSEESDLLQGKFNELDLFGATLEKFIADKSELEKQLKDVQSADTTSAVGSSLAAKRVRKKTVEAIESEIVVTESITNIRKLSRELRGNATDAQKVKDNLVAMFVEIKKIAELRSKESLAVEGLTLGADELDFGVPAEVLASFEEFGALLGEAEEQSQLAAKAQQIYNDVNKKEQVENLDREIKLLDVEKAKAGLIENTSDKMQKEFEIAKKSITLQLERAQLLNKADEIRKLENELDVLKGKLKVEQELLRIKQQQALRKATLGLEKDEENLVLQLEERRRLATAETESGRFNIQQEFALKRLQAEKAAALRKFELDFEGLANEKEVIAAREQLLENFNLRKNLIEAAGQEETQKRLQELVAFIESTNEAIVLEDLALKEAAAIEAIYKDTTLSLEEQQVAEAQIRLKFSLARLALDEETEKASLAIRFTGLEKTLEYETAKQALEQKFRKERESLEAETESNIEEITADSFRERVSLAKSAFAAIEAGWDSVVNNLIRNRNSELRRKEAEKIKEIQDDLDLTLQEKAEKMAEVRKRYAEQRISIEKEASEAIKITTLQAIADILKAEIAAAIKSAFVHKTAEGAKTRITISSVATRIAATFTGIAKETALVLKSIGLYIAQASAKLFSWFASRGPLGIALGIGAVPALMATVKGIVKNVSKFADGAIATNPTLAMFAEAGVPEAAIPLNERGAAFMARLIPKIVIPAIDPSDTFARIATRIAPTGPATPAVDIKPLLQKLDQLGEIVKESTPIINANIDAVKFFRDHFDNFRNLEDERKF